MLFQSEECLRLIEYSIYITRWQNNCRIQFYFGTAVFHAVRFSLISRTAIPIINVTTDNRTISAIMSWGVVTYTDYKKHYYPWHTWR